MHWQASTRRPIKKAAELEETLVLIDGDKRSKQVKEQLEAATKAAMRLMSTLDEDEVVVSMGGAEERVHVAVAVHDA